MFLHSKNNDSIFNQNYSILNQILNKPRLKSNILKFDSWLLKGIDSIVGSLKFYLNKDLLKTE